MLLQLGKLVKDKCKWVFTNLKHIKANSDNLIECKVQGGTAKKSDLKVNVQDLESLLTIFQDHGRRRTQY